mgnify:CR=1 FL=1|tara:strand:- start:24 stop:575 length:552 start_codon:yes stop_codon:yes gene_type:complete
MIKKTELDGLFLITPNIIKDTRGYFFESFRSDSFSQSSIPTIFAQENQSFSKKGTLRGLHYQLNHPQGKLVSVSKGCVLDFAIDIRVGSSTFGKSMSFVLDDIKHESLYIPEGFAHGFYVQSDEAVFSYKCTESYYPEDEYGINWNDFDLKLNLANKKPLVSEKDQLLPKLKDIDKDLLPTFN